MRHLRHLNRTLYNKKLSQLYLQIWVTTHKNMRHIISASINDIKHVTEIPEESLCWGRCGRSSISIVRQNETKSTPGQHATTEAKGAATGKCRGNILICMYCQRIPI